MKLGVPTMAQWKRIQLGTMKLWVESLASLSGLRIWSCLELQITDMAWILHCCGCGVCQQLTAQIPPKACKPPYAMGATLKRHKEKKKRKERRKEST